VLELLLEVLLASMPEVCVVGGLGPPRVACVLFGGVATPFGASPGAGDANVRTGMDAL
jgi:hypothetical protein